MAPDTLYRKLQQHLDRMPVGFPATQSGVEIRILQYLFTPEQAEVALELSAVPEPAKVIHKRLVSKMSLAELIWVLDEMASKGLLLCFPVKDQMHYGKLIFAIGIYERQAARLTPEFERLTRQYLEEAFGEAFHTKKTTQLRTVPVNRPVPVERNVATYDDLRAYVETTAGPFAAINCICRTGKDLLGEKCKQTNQRENCLMIGMAATWTVKAGSGREITRAEMLALLDAADREGLVLEPENTKNPMFVCCCCGCCCNVLISARRLPRPADYFSANFYVEIDAATCESCGLCQTRCQMEAISSDGDGKAIVELARCIGCALCATTCPSGALRMVNKETPRIPPDDSKQLYMRILQERYGPWGMAKMGVRKKLGLKI